MLATDELLTANQSIYGIAAMEIVPYSSGLNYPSL